jgi:hypothetical protein
MSIPDIQHSFGPFSTSHITPLSCIVSVWATDSHSMVHLTPQGLLIFVNKLLFTIFIFFMALLPSLEQHPNLRGCIQEPRKIWSTPKPCSIFVCNLNAMQNIVTTIVSAYKLDQCSHLIPSKRHEENDQKCRCIKSPIFSTTEWNTGENSKSLIASTFFSILKVQFTKCETSRRD